MHFTFKKAALAVGAATLLSSVGMLPAYASPGQTVTNAYQGNLTAANLIEGLIGDNTDYSNVKFTGSSLAIGTFSGFTNLDIQSGVVLSTGLVSATPDADDSNWTSTPDGPQINAYDTTSAVPGPNKADATSFGFRTSENPTPGDADLDKMLIGTLDNGEQVTTTDAISLEFDFIATGNMVQFTYIFASDEYEEYVDAPYNDIFALLVNGQNCALTASGDVVSIHNVNPGKNTSEYRANPVNSNNVDTGFDGLTVPMTCKTEVNKGQLNHIKFVIADAGDDLVDSAVFIEEGSFITDIPDALDDTVTAKAGAATAIPVLGNDTGANLKLTAIASNPKNGTAAIQGNSVVYTPNADFSGSDSFTYTITGVAQATDTAKVTVNVLPSAVDDAVATPVNTPVTVKVLDNDLGTGLVVTTVGNPANGTVTINPAASPSATPSATTSSSDSPSAATTGVSVTYTPKDGFNGTDTFTYTIKDANGSSAQATVTVTVGTPPAPAKGAAVDTGGMAIMGSAPSAVLFLIVGLAIIAGITVGAYALKRR